MTADTTSAVTPDLVFTTAPVDTPPQQDTAVTIEFDGQLLTARRPTDGVLMSLSTAVARRATLADRIEGFLRFLDKSFDPASSAYLAERLENATGDALAALLDQVGAMVEALMARWAPEPAAPAPARSRSRRR